MQKTISAYKDTLITIGPALLITVLAFWVASRFIKPAPPDSITIAAGREDGVYFTYAEQYRTILARSGITLNIQPSAGSSDNTQYLTNEQADIAFIQGGSARGLVDNDTQLSALGSLYYEPLWLFYRQDGEMLQRLTDLNGKKIAIGSEGSGTRTVALQLLSDNRLVGTTLPLDGTEASQALQKGQVDAAIMIAASSSEAVQQLLQDDAIALMNFQRAEAYIRMHRYLSRLSLPEGLIDLQKNIPPTETSLLTATANLVARDDLHPALVYLLLQAASEIHGKAQLFEHKGEFPSPDYNQFPLNEVADRYYQSGPPLLQRFLPFWLATLIDQMKVMLVPLLALLLPLVKVIPPVIRWRTRSRIYRWYEQLKQIDQQSYAQKTAEKMQQLHTDLDNIETEVHQVDIPLSYEDQHYNLRLHINMIREQLNRLDQTLDQTRVHDRH